MPVWRLLAGGPDDGGQHDSGFLAGDGIHEVVAEEDLRSAGSQDTVLGLIVGLDVHGRGVDGVDQLDLGSLAVSAAHTVGLTFGGLDDQLEVGHGCRGGLQLEGEGAAGADNLAGTGSLDTHEGGRRGDGRTAAGDDPVVQAGEQVRAADLALGAKDGTGFLRESELVPGEDLLVGEATPHGGEALEDTFDLGLVAGAYTAAVPAVADILAVLDLCCGHALGAAAHLLEGDGWNVLHSGLGFEVVDNKEYRVDYYYHEQQTGNKTEAHLEALPGGQLLLYLDGLRLNPVTVNDGIAHDFLRFDSYRLPDGLCSQRVDEDSTGYDGFGFGVFILQGGGCIQSGPLFNYYGQLHPSRIPDNLLHDPDFHPGTVPDWKRPDSTASGSGEQKKEWQNVFHRFRQYACFRSR